LVKKKKKKGKTPSTKQRKRPGGRTETKIKEKDSNSRRNPKKTAKIKYKSSEGKTPKRGAGILPRRSKRPVQHEIGVFSIEKGEKPSNRKRGELEPENQKIQKGSAQKGQPCKKPSNKKKKTPTNRENATGLGANIVNRRFSGKDQYGPGIKPHGMRGEQESVSPREAKGKVIGKNPFNPTKSGR